MKSEKPLAIDPEAWEAGCIGDDARNSFVVPLLLDLVAQTSPTRIIDVGCGTGYLTRRLLAHPGSQNVHYALLDISPNMIEFARRKIGSGANVEYHNTSLQDFVEAHYRARYDIVICAYALLEVARIDGFARSLISIARGGVLVVVLPDTVEDIVEHHLRASSAYRSSKSPVEIQKRNSFTGRRQTFWARQPIDFLLPFVACGPVPLSVRAFNTKKGQRHLAFIMDFRGESVNELV